MNDRIKVVMKWTCPRGHEHATEQDAAWCCEAQTANPEAISKAFAEGAAAGSADMENRIALDLNRSGRYSLVKMAETYCIVELGGREMLSAFSLDQAQGG